jgi:hypothetical protein
MQGSVVPLFVQNPSKPMDYFQPSETRGGGAILFIPWRGVKAGKEKIVEKGSCPFSALLVPSQRKQWLAFAFPFFFSFFPFFFHFNILHVPTYFFYSFLPHFVFPPRLRVLPGSWTLQVQVVHVSAADFQG